MSYQLQSQDEKARNTFESVAKDIESKIVSYSDSARFGAMEFIVLGQSYAHLGEKDKAIEAGTRALEITDISKDAYDGYAIELGMAKIYCLVGELDLALERLEYLLSIPGDFSIEILKLDPEWEPLRKTERYASIINNPEFQVK